MIRAVVIIMWVTTTIGGGGGSIRRIVKYRGTIQKSKELTHEGAAMGTISKLKTA
jgi:hypothetical protein